MAPLGNRTQIELSPAGYLSEVTNPADETTQLTHSATGLLATLTDPRQGVHQFAYDAEGLLERDEGPGGFFQTLARSTRFDTTANGIVRTDSVTRTTTMGRTVSYVSISRLNGQRETRVIDPAGLVSTSVSSPNDSTRSVSSDGTVTAVVLGPDPRFGMSSPIIKQMRTTMPSGLSSLMTMSRRVTLADPLNTLSLQTQIDSVVVNGRVVTSTYNVPARSAVQTSAEGRQTFSTLDSLGRVTQLRTPGAAAVKYTYGPRGFLTSVAQAGRVVQYAYDSAGRVKSVTDPTGRTERYAYDSVGRARKQTLPNGREILYAYDANGNLTSLTPPGRPVHTFTYTPADQTEVYTPPAAGVATPATQYQYNLDRQLTQVTRPDGLTIGVGYDGAGRPSGLTLPNGQVTFGYHPQAGHLSTITAVDGGTLGYTYDGSLLKTATWGGAVQGAVGYTYDNNFRVTGISVNGANTISLGYDRDNLLTSAGGLTLSRDPQNGRLTGTTLGSVTTSWTYDDSTSAVGHYAAKHGANTLLDVAYTRDSLDRIVQMVETVDGVAKTFGFVYDSAGRLDQVRVGGVLVSDYDYDANGNRIALTTQAGTVTGVVDDQDRLVSYGGATYAYGANGELVRKVVGTDTTRYAYDALGNLLQVKLPDGTVIDYLVDGHNRRIGKKVNGALVQGLLYQGRLTPVAETDGTGQLVSRFVYATRVNVPDYMIRNGVTYRLVTDRVGSVRVVVVPATGQVVQRLDYDEFGRVTTNTNPGFQPFGFAGGLLDEQTGLTRFGARDYMPDVGRWTAKDPLGFEGGDANQYAYVGNDPINASDPTGLFIDTLLDLGFTAADAYSLYRSIRDGCPISEDLLALAGDIIGTAIPGVTGLGKAARRAAEAADAARAGRRSAVDIGDHAGESITARSSGRDFTAAERAEINRIGSKTGCHTCGATNPGTKSGNFVPDHQPPSALNPSGGPQRLYPHCINCRREQGLEIARRRSQRGP